MALVYIPFQPSISGKIKGCVSYDFDFDKVFGPHVHKRRCLSTLFKVPWMASMSVSLPMARYCVCIRGGRGEYAQ